MLRATYPLATHVFQANATNKKEISNQFEPKSVDIVFTDVPYGGHSQWYDPDLDDFPNPLTSMLDALLGAVSPSSIVAISSDKQQKAVHERYQRIEHFQVGKRRVVILKSV